MEDARVWTRVIRLDDDDAAICWKVSMMVALARARVIRISIDLAHWRTKMTLCAIYLSLA